MFKKFGERLLFTILFCGILSIFAAVSHELHVATDSAAQARKMVTNNQGYIKKALFSPDHDIKTVILGLIKSTRGHIYLTTYTLTDKDIAQALIDKRNEGVAVEIVADYGCAKTPWSKVPLLEKARIPLYVFPQCPNTTEKFGAALMHNKFIVFVNAFDNKTIVLTGSFNLTWSAANKNQENILVLEDYELAQTYIKQFGVLKERSKLLGTCRIVDEQTDTQTLWSRLKAIFAFA